MLAALVGFQVVAGLILRGAADAGVQSLVLVVVVLGIGATLAFGAAKGRVELPLRSVSIWAAALAALSLLSALRSSPSVHALPAWFAAAAGLWLFPATTLLDGDERSIVEQAVRAVAWVLVFLAIYQRVHGEPRPGSAFPDPSAFAGAVLLLLPFAARRGDVLLVAGLLACLWWTRSVGAWLGLSVALMVNRRAVGAAAFWAGASVGFVCLVAAYAGLDSAETSRRWLWWDAAWRMGVGAPWAGQYGGLYLILWIGGLVALLLRAKPGLRVGVIAALVHGLFDSSLSVPGVFWLFCLSAAWILPEAERSAAVRGGRRIAFAVAALASAAVVALWLGRGWKAEVLQRGERAISVPRLEGA